MKTRMQILPRSMCLVALLLFLARALGGCALNTRTWKEEVLLHDGQRIMVKRWETTDPKGLRYRGQSDPLSEVGLVFTPPGSDTKIEWKSDWGLGLQGNLYLLLLDFKEGIPYIATTTGRCNSYNTWGRPNPPYVFFKFDGQAWHRITLEEFPEEFKEANVVVWYGHNFSPEERSASYLTVEMIKKINSVKIPDEPPYRQVFIREPLAKGDGLWRCEELIFYKGYWISPKGNFGRDLVDKLTK